MNQNKIAEALKKKYRLEGTLTRLAGENENYLVVCPDNTKYVLKLDREMSNRDRILLEHAAVEAAHTYDLGVALPRLVPDNHGDVVPTFVLDKKETSLGRLLHFVSGDAWGVTTPAPRELLLDLGSTIAHLTKALSKVKLPISEISHAWDIAAMEVLSEDINLVSDIERRRLLARQFERLAAAKQDLVSVTHGLIHGDLNDDNLLVSNKKICGILDFGDALYNPLVCDLAIALAYILLDEPDPWLAGAYVVGAYHRVRALTHTEIELLYPLIGARLALSLLMSTKRRRIDPAREAWFVTEERAWTFLQKYGAKDPIEVADKLASIITEQPYPQRGSPKEKLQKRRRAVVSSAQSISYSEPLQFIRGRGAYLIDEKGNPYLDLYNNVCHVGHCHPKVVVAGQKQLARLNTNTRYLTEEHIAYAERLAALFPKKLDTVFLVNSGSEANELALRLACAHTGKEDVLVVENAYHGHTQKLVHSSPYKFMGPGGKGRPESWVHVTPMPDSFRGPHKEQTKKSGLAYGNAVKPILEKIKRPVAAFMAETLLSCGGQIIPPPGYFEVLFKHIRDAGGLCILDEVQTGFGRVGSHFWAFEMYNVIPDIVVLGKPIGNGHPMGAVICRREIARSFEATGMEFFATFGGNPVSCAIGNAVLDVIEEEKLQVHAQYVGAYFLEALQEVAKEHAAIGDVRGQGLFLGIELVKEDGLKPAAELANNVVNALREQRILTGTDGPHNNVIKIKPPLVIKNADVDRFVFELDTILDQLE